MADKATQRECNILFLGESQSGKSTLIECLKKYADPDYIVNRLNIGDGIFSYTSNVIKTTINTNLPTSHVLGKQEERIDYGTFLEGDQEDYEDELNERRKYRMEREESNSDQVTFNLYDTPGLNEIALFDEKNIAIIFSALEKEKVPSINLVIITIANNPFTEDLQNALKAYINLLPDLNGNIVFVHTKIDYSKLHPQEEQFVLTLKEKKRILHHLMGRDTVPHVLIDNDINSTRVIRNCMTQNKLRELLAIAKLNQPIPLQIMYVNKTEKMRTIEVILKQKCDAKITALEAELLGKNETMETVLARRLQIENVIAMLEQDLQTVSRDLAFYDKETLELLYEERYDQAWSMTKISEPRTAMYYPGRIISASSGFISHTLDLIDIQAHNIEVMRTAGGVGENHWAVQFRRECFQNGVFHVKIYIKKSKMYVREIERLRTQELVIKSTILELQSECQVCGAEGQEIPVEVQVVMEELGKWRHILGRISAQRLHLGVFQAVMDADVYVRDDSVSAANLESHFWEMKTKIEELEESARLFAMSLNQDEETLELVDSDEHVEDPGLFAEVEEKDARREAEEAEALALDESRKEAAPSPFPSPNRSGNVGESQYSILVFGRTQAGKSTFIEFVRNYANPDHAIDKNLIGSSNFSKTETSKEFIVTSDLPSHEVCHEDSHEPIDTEVLCQSCNNMDDYADAINNKKTTCRLAQQNSNHLLERPVTIKFLDTPGINDTNCRDVEHAKRIIDGMLNVKSFNLIVVIVNIKHPIHREQRVAFNYYSRVIHALQGHLSNVVFVYTHVEYKCRHHTNINHHEALDRAHRAFSCLFREGAQPSEDGVSDLAMMTQESDMDLYPRYVIDLKKHRPICKCMMQETIRDILRLAVTTPAASFNMSKENLDRVWAMEHPDKKNYEAREKKAKEEEFRKRQQAEAQAGVEKKATPIPLTDLIQPDDSPNAQSADCQGWDIPDWCKSVLGIVSDRGEDCDDGDDEEERREKEETGPKEE
ncbi:hypothetical protein BG006_006822 [Podila minutissima]|uniref:G domain-containing protein n=1 Tax=Podila minutissima TaxID=64525 RepID=A0A9P5SI50_9FUNG|nr:hypothetical protein BG006_006822 [Podila minutissima]